MEKEGLTHKELEELCGIKQSYVSNVDSKSDPCLSSILKILRPLGKTLKIVPIDESVSKH